PTPVSRARRASGTSSSTWSRRMRHRAAASIANLLHNALAATVRALKGTVDRGAADAEQLGQLADGVLLGGMQLDEMSLLSWVELRTRPPPPALGLADPPPFAGSGANEVGFELGDHRQHVEQQFAHRVRRVIHRSGDAEFHLPRREAIG